MSPGARRSTRLRELQALVNKLGKEGKTPEQIIKAVKLRANQMASKSTAKEYVEEIIEMNSK